MFSLSSFFVFALFLSRLSGRVGFCLHSQGGSSRISPVRALKFHRAFYSALPAFTNISDRV